MNLSQFPGVFKATFERWRQEDTFRLGASLAYYTAFAVAPLVVISVSIAGLVFSKERARGQITDEVATLAGPQVADAVGTASRYLASTEEGWKATLISLVVLLAAATSLFAELQGALNTIWGVKTQSKPGLWELVKARLLSFAAVLGLGFLLLVSLVISAGLTALGTLVTPKAVPGTTYLWEAVNWLVSFGLVTVLFAMIYKFMPDAEIDWGDVWVGAVVTSLLFAVGKYLIGLYLGHSAVVSAYGAAGSLVVILLWVYYSSQILLFGAAFTRVYADSRGKRVVAKPIAEPAEEGALPAGAEQGRQPVSP